MGLEADFDLLEKEKTTSTIPLYTETPLNKFS
jgi:hypothetical protein